MADPDHTAEYGRAPGTESVCWLECGECGHPVRDHLVDGAWYRWRCGCGCLIVVDEGGQYGATTMTDDPRHRYTCDWNLYPDQRPDAELCNLGCLDDPEGVAASRAYVDAQSDGEAGA